MQWAQIAFPTTFFVLGICSGCFTNRAVYDPLSYAPGSPSNPWSPPKAALVKTLPEPVLEIPEQDSPFSLGELIDMALINNPQTKLTWAQARSAAAQYGQSQYLFFPQFSGSYTFQRARQPAFVSTASPQILNNSNTVNSVSVQDIYYSIYGPQLAISYLIFDFGTKLATSEAARQALYYADWTHNDAILTLLQTVINDFYNFVYQKEQLKANVENVETAQLTLTAAEARLNTGVTDVSDYLQAKTQYLQAQTNWAAQQQNVETTYATLLSDMGIPANQRLQIQEFIPTLPENDYLPPLDSLIAVAKDNRPDLLAAEANLRSQEQNLKAANRQFLPQFNYNFDLGKTYFNKGLHDKYNFTSTFSVSMPLFAGFYYRNAIKMARANKMQAEEQLRETELNMIREITTYHYNVHIAYETLHFAIDYRSAATEQYTVALKNYKEGTNTILDVVSAQNSLENARANVVRAYQQWYTSLANLAYSTGLLSPTALNPMNPEEVYDEQKAP